MQRNFLLDSRGGQRPGLNIVQVVGHLQEELDTARFKAAWQHVANRHAILRSCVCFTNGHEPLLKTGSQGIEFDSQDWRGLPQDHLNVRFEGWLRSDRRRGFRLDEAPLMRLALLRFDERDYRMVWTLHHLLLDARSFGLVLREVFNAYELLRQGLVPQFAEPRLFRDFVGWQSAQDFSDAKSFWRSLLEGAEAPAQFDLPPPTSTFAEEDEPYGEQMLVLSSEATSRLKSLVAADDVTLGTVVLGAWALLLSFYSGKDDLVFGAVRAGRRSACAGADEMVGLLINTLPVRIRIDGQLSVRQWLAGIRKQQLAVRPYEHTPLTKILEWSGLAGGGRLFHSIVSFQNPSWHDALRDQGGPWLNRDFRVINQPDYPLWLDAYAGKEMVLKIGYDRTALEDGSIGQIAVHLRTILEQVADDDEQRLGDVSPFTPAEQERMLVSWNNTAASFPTDQCVHERFEAQCTRTPGALAISTGDKQWSYAELNAAANRLASCLEPNVRGTVVGICLDRSPELVIAILAVLKAGAAYAPLDPTYPRQRLARIISNARMPVVLTLTQRREYLSATGARVMCLDALSDSLAAVSQPDHQSASTADPAYIIFTSGSTGEPKGVAITHRSLLNLIAWHQREYCVTQKDRATLIASPGFDASVWELWPYLTAGASIHIPDELTRLSPARLVAWLHEQRITLSFVPTPLAERLFTETWPERLDLRALLTGGDRLHRPPPGDFPCALVNHYGPTESTVVTTSAIVGPRESCAHPPPIGRPIANTQIYLLDRHLRIVPVGVPGELHIGGESLAQGYLNDPELTAEKFIPSPFARAGSSRLYRSGDLARYRLDGQIEFIGRTDHQVKIRGCRIEVGEIETQLLQYPGVKEAAVIVDQSSGDGDIRAFIVPRSEVSIDVTELRSSLGRQLPEVMLPASFNVLEALPLTAHGKLDCHALSLLPRAPANDMAIVPARNSLEKTLVGMWCEVLGRKRLGIHDNFFQIGGDSLAAARVVARAADLGEPILNLHDIFDSPTIAALAEKLGKRDATPPPRPPCGAPDPGIPLSFAQERIWFLEQLTPNTALHNIPAAFKVQGTLDVGALERALIEIVNRHGVFQTAFRQVEGQPVASRDCQQAFELEQRDFSALPKGQASRQARQLIEAEVRRAFDLRQAPLFRAHLLKLAPEEHWLLLVTHHIVCDGWSMDILHRELSVLYHAFVQGAAPDLAPLPVDYADFARRQRQSIQGKTLDQLLDFWTQTLAGMPPTVELPTDKPRPPVQTYRGASLPIELPPKLVGELESLSRREGVTLFMLLLASFQTLLHRYSAQSDVPLGSPVASRPDAGSEGTVGLFLNTVVFRGDCSGDPTFRDLLKRTRRTVLEALAHQQLPFEKLADAIQPERDLSRSPLVQVLFVLQNEPLRQLELNGLEVSPFDLHTGTAKFDLTLSLQPMRDGLSGYLEYNSDLFTEASIARTIGHFQTLLEGIVREPDQHLSRLPLLTTTERDRMLREWNDTGMNFPAGRRTHELFEEQVARTPSHIALAFGEEEMTYTDLNARADRLAAKLRSLGVGPGSRVGICMGRSLTLVAGLLGILKAGGAYVPLDPAYPKARLDFILKDSEAAVLLTASDEPTAFASASANANPERFDGFSIWSTGDKPRSSPSDQLAYVIYTSGSTGNPKGVMVTHRNVVNFCKGMERLLGHESGVWLAVTSISFDISVLELLWTLTRGFKVVIHDTSSTQSLSVADQILRHKVTHLQCTPSLAGTLILSPESVAAVGSLKALLVGGEALPVALAQKLRRTGCGELFNMYGPTETTIWSTAHRILETEGSVPIGHPIANTEIYVLDGHLQPVPVGVAAELFIGGEGVARGYFNRPELTREKFIPHPFSSDAAARLYRTGDRARYCADGTLEFLGRFDQQIKVRGHRVELGEIESILRQHPAVRDCVVDARTDATGDFKLVAYVVGVPDRFATDSELRGFLGVKLPEYMIPNGFVPMEALPRTPNGKIDRRALPAPNAMRPTQNNARETPRTDIEKQIAQVWRELLGLGSVGLHDNFFDLGGHSLLVIRSQARLRELLGVNVPVVRLFQYPTVSTLAGFLAPGGEPTGFKSARARGRRRSTIVTPPRPEQLVS